MCHDFGSHAWNLLSTAMKSINFTPEFCMWDRMWYCLLLVGPGPVNSHGHTNSQQVTKPRSYPHWRLHPCPNRPAFLPSASASLFNLHGMPMDRNPARMLPRGAHAACIEAQRGCTALKEREDMRPTQHLAEWHGAAPRRACHHYPKILVTTCIYQISSLGRRDTGRW
jgi:hypothetical protein